MDNKTQSATIHNNQLLCENKISDWMDLKETAAYLRTKESHVRDLVFRKEIPFSKLGRLLRFHKPTIDRWLLSK